MKPAVVVVVIAAVVFAVLPLLVMLGVAVGLPGGLSLDALSAVLETKNLVALRESVVVSAGAVFVAVAVGLPWAVLVERTDIPGARALGAIGALPLAIPPYILAFGFRALFDDRVGLAPLPAWLGSVDSRGGIAVVLGVAFLPLVVLRLRASLSAIDGSLEEAARVAGASALRSLVDHTLPLVLPSLLSSMALVFVAAAASWGVPVLLGLAADPPVVVVTARIAVALQGGALREALGLSLALAAVAGVAFALPTVALRARNVVVVSGKAARKTELPLGRARVVVGVVAWATAFVLVIGPLLALVVQGLLKSAGAGVALGNLSLVHVQRVLGRDDVRDAAAASAALAIGAAVVVIAAAVVVGAALRVRRVGERSTGPARVLGQLVGRGIGGVRGVSEVVYALPGTIVAVALVLAFSRDVRVILFDRVTLSLVLGGTAALLLVAYAIKHAALGLRAVDEALSQVHPSLEEAARTSGATPGRAFVDVTLPLLRAHLTAAAVAVALPCFTELTMSVLLQAPGTQTLGVLLFSLYDYGDPQQAMALSALLVALVLLAQLIIVRLRARQNRGSTAHMTVTVPPPPGKDTRQRKQARADLVDVLFDARGNRRLPEEDVLTGAIEALGATPADRARALWWVCEANSRGPLYLLPTRGFITALSDFLDEQGARSVLEVAAGDGFVSACLQEHRPDLRVIASDDFSWTKPQGRMNDADRAEFAGVDLRGIEPLPIVEQRGAVAAVNRHRPDVVLVCWAPPGTLVERVIRAASARLVVDIGVDGDVCGNGMATWRFEKEFLDGPLEQRALCRLDADPRNRRMTTATLYFGKGHRRFGVEASGGLIF